MQLTLTKLPWYAQVGAFVALAVGSCAAFYYYIEIPARADMASRVTQLNLLKTDVAKGLMTAKKLPEFRAQALSTRVYAFLLAMIDGERSIRDMARLMEQQKLMPADDALPAIRRFLVRALQDPDRRPQF